MGIAAIAHGGYRLVYIEVKPDQECVMVVRGESVTEVTILRAIIPGITMTKRSRSREAS